MKLVVFGNEEKKLTPNQKRMIRLCGILDKEYVI